MDKIVSAEAAVKVRATLNDTIHHYDFNYRDEDQFTVKTVVAILRSLRADLLDDPEGK